MFIQEHSVITNMEKNEHFIDFYLFTCEICQFPLREISQDHNFFSLYLKPKELASSTESLSILN